MPPHRRDHSCGIQFHTRSATKLSRWNALRRALERNCQHRRAGIRRQWPGKPGGRRSPEVELARPIAPDHHHAASSRRGLFQISSPFRACLKSRSRRKKVHFFNYQTGRFPEQLEPRHLGAYHGMRVFRHPLNRIPVRFAHPSPPFFARQTTKARGRVQPPARTLRNLLMGEPARGRSARQYSVPRCRCR